MTTTIGDLPNELLSALFENVVHCKREDKFPNSFGLKRAVRASQNVDLRMQHLVKGAMTPDSLRFTATGSIGQVNQRWHECALAFA